MTEVEINVGKAMTVGEQETPPASVLMATPEPAAEQSESFGRALAAARQARGLSQGEVAAQLRLHLRQVRAIENEDLGALPEGPFVRGFVRNYAKLVDLPAEPLLALLAARLKPTEPLRTDGAGAISPVQLAAREHVSRWTVIGGALTMLVLFAVLGWWTMRPLAPTAPEVTATVPTPPAVPAVSPTPATAEASSAQPTSETAAAPAVDDAPVVPTALHFTFRDRAWVEVKQADGSVLMSRNNDGGTRETLDGTPPYTVVIGNASMVDLEFRGKPVDLAAIASRDDVARLRLE